VHSACACCGALLNKYEIAIAGAGPGGLAAALALHRAGHRVVVYDQFDAPKPVGSGLILQPTGLGVLDWLGLGQRMRGLGARIDRLYGAAARNGRTVLDVRYDAIGAQRGLAVHRAALFAVLHDAVNAAGISIETRKHINGFHAGALTFGEGPNSPRFDLVVDALGARSPLRQCLPQRTPETALAYGAVWASLPWPLTGFDPHALEQRYDKASVMIGVLPIGRMVEGGTNMAAFFWSLKANDHAAWVKRGLTAWKAEVLHHWPQTEPLLHTIQHTDDLTLARYQHHTVLKPWGERLVSIGDSAHSTSPQLGQGANNALLDVQALVEAIERNANVAEATSQYARQRRRHVRTYQLLSRMFTPFYQSDSTLLPLMRDYVVPPLARLPVAQRLLAHMVAGTVVSPIVQ
jgi:2-polyprenyl-6-methoxyphenol hydroxylase-like FAD-dependent oxidoreductase